VPSLLRLAIQIAVKGEPNIAASPCGAKCSYFLEFAGPYPKYEPSVATQNLDMLGSSNFATMYNANSSMPFYHKNNSIYSRPLKLRTAPNITESRVTFIASQLPLFWGTMNTTFANGTTALIESPFVRSNMDILTCVPARARYTYGVSYQDNI
jgi:hypothetical protein